jgi:hypothetical protein
MTKWETCRLGQEERRSKGGFSGDRIELRWVAYLFTTEGEKPAANGDFLLWQDTPERRDEIRQQKVALIARLGTEGWEPIPLSVGTGTDSVSWHFKRAT